MSSHFPRARLGQVLEGRFQLEQVLGEGGMGSVFLARDLASQRPVAVKLAQQSSEATRLQRFLREGEISARLDHPGIVRIHTAGEVLGVPFLVYELVSGARQLAELSPGLSVDQRLDLLEQVADALGYAHSLGVVHRDVKPENVLVDEHGRARLSDFGIATLEDHERLTATGAFVGTPLYMAPEAFTGRGAAPATDVWSLGVILYEALTGELPFQGTNIVALAPQILRAEPRRPRSLDRAVSPALEALCLRALCKDPGQRPPDGAAFAHELREARAGRGAARQRRRRGPFVVAGVLVALSLGGAGLWAASSSDFSPTPTPSATPRPSKTPRPALPPGWALKRGQSWRARLEWRDVWKRRADAPPAPDTTFLIDVDMKLTVRDVRGGVANLQGELLRVRFRVDDADFDSAGSNATGMLLPMSVMAGAPFTVHVEVPSGRVRRVIGIDHTREQVIQAAMEPARPTIEATLTAWTDAVIRAHLDVSFHHPPGGGRLERQLQMNGEHAALLRCVARTGATPHELSWVMESHERLRSHALIATERAEGTATYAEGRVVRASRTAAGEIRRKGGHYERGELVLRYTEFPPE